MELLAPARSDIINKHSHALMDFMVVAGLCSAKASPGWPQGDVAEKPDIGNRRSALFRPATIDVQADPGW
jgi:hypothetical protein